MNREELSKQMEKIQKRQKVKRKTSFRKNSSCLDKFKGEIMYLRQVEGASYREIQIWLLENKRLNVCRSTIQRRVELWINGER